MSKGTAAEHPSGMFPRGFSQSKGFPWPLVRAESLAELKYGSGLKRNVRRDGLIPVYGTNGQCGWHDEALVRGPGIILGRKGQGPLGVEWSDTDFWVIDTAYYVARRARDLDLKYFYYLVDYIGLNHLKDGTSNPGLSRDTFYAQLLPLPPLDVQQAIASILGALDDKIELNRQMNETLEAMARAIFKSWFVDFDPVRAKTLTPGPSPRGRGEDGALTPGPSPRGGGETANVCDGGDDSLAPSPSGGRLGWGNFRLSSDILALFPDSFQDSPLGKIPKGWIARKWGDLVTLEYGKGLRGYRDAEGPVPVYGTNGLIGRTDVPLVNGEGIIVGRKGAYRGVHYSSLPFHAIDTAFFVQPVGVLELRWAYYTLLQEDINSMDSGSAIPSTSRSDFYQMSVVLPPLSIQRRFARQLGSCWQRQEANESESIALAAARDALLPKLLSGQIRVKDAEKVAGAAT